MTQKGISVKIHYAIKRNLLEMKFRCFIYKAFPTILAIKPVHIMNTVYLLWLAH